MTELGARLFVDTHSRRPRSVALSYMAFGLFWVVCSDALLYVFGRMDEPLLAIQLLKGAVLVALTALLIYLLLRYPHGGGRIGGGGSPRMGARGIASAGYLVFGLLAVFGSDYYLYRAGAQGAAFMATQWLMGSAFVLLSAFVIFFLARLPPETGFSARPDWRAADTAAQWQALPKRMALSFAVILLGSSLLLDVYQASISHQIAPADFWVHGAESLLLTAFGALTLYALLSHMSTLASKALAREIQSEQRYHSLFAHNPAAVYLLDPDGRFVEINDALCGLTGLERDDILGRSWEPMAAPENLDYVREQFSAALNGEPRTYEALGRRPNGEKFHVQVTNIPRYEGGEITGVYGVARDITLEKTFHQRVAASEARFRALFEHSLDAVFLTRPDGAIEAANPAAEAMLGMSEAELKARGRGGITDPSDPAVNRSIQERERTGRSHAVIRMIRGNGERFSAEVSAVQFRSADGEDLVSVVVRDITEQLEQERQLEASETRYQALYHSHPDAVFEFDPEGRIIQANETVEQITGYAVEEVLGQRFDPLVHPDDLPLAWEHFKAVVAGETRSFRVRGIRKNGQTFWAQVIGVPRTEHGELVGVAGIVRDIDAEHRAQQELAESEARYRILYEHSPDAVLLVDAQTGVNLDANSVAEQLFGAARSQIIGRVRMAEEDKEDPEFRAFLETRRREGRARCILSVRRADGSQFPADVISTRFHDRQGRELAITTVRDISEQVAREAELGASEARYRVLFEQSAEAIFLTAPNGRIFAANRAAEALFGYSEAELCELGRAGLVDKNEPAFQNLMEDRREHDRAQAEIHMRRKDGSWFLASISVLGFKDSAGRDRTSVVLRDVTLQREREEQIRASEERYRALFLQSLDAIFISDAETRVLVAANPAAESLFGMSEAALCARPAEEMLDVNDSNTRNYFETRERKGAARARLRMKRGDDSWFTAEVTSRLFRNAEGRLMANTIIRDVTEQEAYEKQLAKSEERFRIVADNTGQAIYELNLETDEIAWAGAVESMFGYTKEELVTMGAQGRLMHVPESERDRVATTYSNAAETGGSFHMEYSVNTRDGSEVLVEDWGIVLKDRECMYGVIQDVTEKRRLVSDLEAREQALSEVSQVQQAILDALPAHIALLDRDGTVRYVNAAWRRFAQDNDFLGRNAGVGSNYLSICDGARGRDAEIARTTASGIRQVVGGLSRDFGIEYPCHSPDTRRWFQLAVTPFRAGDRHGAVVAHVDVSDRREAERQLELVAAAFRSADEAMLLCDANFEILDVNHAYERITGRGRDDAIGSRPLFLEIEQQERNIRRSLQAEGQWRGELLQRRMDGKVFVSRAAVNEVPDPEGRRPYLVVNFDDISELREYERKVDYLSYHDPLTGLPNRAALAEWFQNFEPGPDASGEIPPFAFVFIDLDRLKTVNDAYGHRVGDELITELGRRLRAVCEGNDYVARLIGDEFVMVIADVADAVEAREVLQRRMKTLTAPLKRGEFVMHPTVCAGIALAPEHGTSLEELLRKADVAMHEAKRHGRGETVLFSAEMTAEVEQQLVIERHLREGIDNREFLLHYQPSVRLDSGRVMGLEALVRWNNPELGLVPPARFIPVAEDSGLIIDLGDWVFEEVCRQIAEWRDASVSFGWVAVNLSPIQFQDPGLLNKLRNVMERYDVAGELIRVEITESVLVMDPDWTISLLQSLRELGIQIAVDDFGTGYSSLAYLKRFPVDFIKLDKTFISGLPADATDASIVSSVIELAKQLGMGVVAEGIERKDQLDFLVHAGCQEAQGYYFSLPLSTEDVPWLLRSHVTLPVDGSAVDEDA